MSNLIYWISIHTPLTIIEHHRHVFDEKSELVDDEYIVENHAIMMYQPFLEEHKNL